MTNYTSTGPETDPDNIAIAGVCAALTTCITLVSSCFVNKVLLPPCTRLAEKVGGYLGSCYYNYRRYNSETQPRVPSKFPAVLDASNVVGDDVQSRFHS